MWGRRPKRELSGGSVSHPWLTRRPRHAASRLSRPGAARRAFARARGSAAQAAPAHPCVLRTIPAPCDALRDVRVIASLFENSRNMELQARTPPDCRGDAPSAPATEQLPARRYRAKESCMRYPRAAACGSGADVQAAGDTPGRPVAPPLSDASKKTAGVDARFSGDDSLKRARAPSASRTPHAGPVLHHLRVSPGGRCRSTNTRPSVPTVAARARSVRGRSQR
jgi:hypothetical protein